MMKSHKNVGNISRFFFTETKIIVILFKHQVKQIKNVKKSFDNASDTWYINTALFERRGQEIFEN